MRKWLALAVAVAMLTAACSPDDTADETTSTTSTTVETITTSTTPAVTTTTTTAPATTTTTVGTTTPTVFDTNQLAEGSGCTPGTDDLPDGVWYGTVDSYDSDGFAFDLACWFSGDAAVLASAEDGEESPPPNDYYVRDQNPKLRDLDVAAETPVRWYLSGDPNEFVDGTFTGWIEFLDTVPFILGVWVTVEDGAVVSIEEQWVP